MWRPRKNGKILRLQWNNEKDTNVLQDNFNPDLDNTCLTKRELLQQSSKIFDPLGILSPVSVGSKLLMQKLWKKYEWDEPLPDEIKYIINSGGIDQRTQIPLIC